MAEVMIWDPVERLLWGIAILIIVLLISLFIFKAKKKDDINQKMFLYGVSAQVFCILIDRLLRFLNDFLIQGTFINFVFYGDFTDLPLVAKSIYKIAQITFVIGQTLFIVSIAVILNRGKYILSTTYSIIVILMIISPFNLTIILFGVMMNTNFIIVIISYYFFFKRSKKEFRLIAIFLLFGTIIIGHSIIFAFYEIRSLNIIPLFLAPLLSIIGSSLFLTPLIIDPEKSSKILKFWSLMLIFYIIISFFLTFTYLISPIFRSFLAFHFIHVFIVIYVIIKMVKITKSEVTLRSKDSYTEIFKAFTKPQKITEEEITISKEKKICLVCKGELGGKMFMCSECGTFYCNKCSDALSNLENVCWVCNEALDKSKPSKPYREEKVEETDVLEKSKNSKI